MMMKAQGTPSHHVPARPSTPRRAFAVLTLALTCSLASACAGLVGEECAPGYVAKDDTCVPVVTITHSPGHGVFLGMDFAAITPLSREAHLLGNAVFMASHKPVRILDYRELTEWNASSVTNVVDLISSEALVRHRTVQTTVAENAEDVPTELQLANVDVLFVHDQVNAPAGKLAEIGAKWEPAVSAFLKRSGIVIVLATAQGTNEMGELLTASGLLTIKSLAPTTIAHVRNMAPADPIGHGVSTPLHGKQDLAYFMSDEPSVLSVGVVLDDPTGGPVALHTYR
jgi:hypothetical protein